MKKYSPALLIFVEIFLVGIIGFLGYKIWQISQDRVKGVYVTRINKDDVVFDLQNKNLKYFYEPKPNTIQVDHPDWLGYEVKYTINSDSLNERFDYSITKQQRTYRVVTIGDSFTFGQNVNTAENYSELLEDILNQKLKCLSINKFEVINLGVEGYDIEYAIYRLEKRGLKYNPDLVIWLINDSNYQKINEHLSQIREELKTKDLPIFDPKTQTYPIVEQALKIFLNKYGENFRYHYQENLFKQLNSIHPGNLLIITYPTISTSLKNIIENFTKFSNNYLYYDNLINTFASNSLHLLDHHPSREGHKKIAADIFDYLRNNYFKNCISQ